MYKFGSRSRKNLDQCHPKLQEIAEEAIKLVDFSVICGHRSEAEQNAAYESGNSKLRWPQSKHNKKPSRAMDIIPYPVDWHDIKRFAHMVGIIKGIAHSKGIKIRSGADWDMDGDITDHKFMDWPHIELADDEE